jgi:hypothetical protein
MGRVIGTVHGSPIEMLDNLQRMPRRRYYDPRDGTWTNPLPGDSFWERYYVKKGFKLTAPDGSGPPSLGRS